MNTKASCLKYVENASKSAQDRLSKFVETKKAISTKNKILKNPDIDRRCVSSILESYGEKRILANYEKLS